MKSEINNIVEEILNRKFGLALDKFKTLIQKHKNLENQLLTFFYNRVKSFMKLFIIEQKNITNKNGTVSKNNISRYLELTRSISALENGYCHIMNIFDTNKTKLYSKENLNIKTEIEIELALVNINN